MLKKGSLTYNNSFLPKINEIFRCQNECYTHEHAQAVIYRLSNMTGVPETNAEYLQLLRYEEGQFYKAHHDYIALHKNR